MSAEQEYNRRFKLGVAYVRLHLEPLILQCWCDHTTGPFFLSSAPAGVVSDDQQ